MGAGVYTSAAVRCADRKNVENSKRRSRTPQAVLVERILVEEREGKRWSRDVAKGVGSFGKGRALECELKTQFSSGREETFPLLRRGARKVRINSARARCIRIAKAKAFPYRRPVFTSAPLISSEELTTFVH